MDSRWLFIILILVILLTGIISTVLMYLPLWRCPLRVRRSINQLNNNLPEIIKICKYFQKQKNRDKLSSLYFLLESMQFHYYVNVGLKDENGKQIDYDASKYNDFRSAEQKFKKLAEENKDLNWHVIDLYRDTEVITSELMIENIEEAYSVWHENAWSKGYSKEIFDNYILPYRGSSEPLESFRPYFRTIFKNKIHTECPIEAATIINDELKTRFGFNSKYYLHPTDLGLKEMLQTGQGRCEDMTNFSIYAMRANGIAVTSDYTPHWAVSGNNHAWNAVLTYEGKAIPFMGCESNPGDYKLRNRIAKVYRKMFSPQSGSLGGILKDGEKAPAWLGGKNYLDVTSDYVHTDRVVLEVDTLAAEERFLYLTVFNDGDWEAIAWSELDGNIAVFEDVGTDLIYLPCYYIDSKLIPASSPFLFNKKGEVEYLEISESRQDMILHSTTKLRIRNQTGEREITNLDPGKVYKLHYWQDDWQKAGEKKFIDKELKFDNIPAEGLYLLIAEDSDGDERIFIYIAGKQIWY